MDMYKHGYAPFFMVRHSRFPHLSLTKKPAFGRATHLVTTVRFGSGDAGQTDAPGGPAAVAGAFGQDCEPGFQTRSGYHELAAFGVVRIDSDPCSMAPEY